MLQNFGKMAFGAVALGGYAIYSEIDKSTNYTEVAARVLSAQSQCMTVDDRGNRRSYARCDLHKLRSVRKSDMRREVSFDFEYISPVDGTTQYGDATKKFRIGEAYPKSGSLIRLYAHNSQPPKHRVF